MGQGGELGGGYVTKAVLNLPWLVWPLSGSCRILSKYQQRFCVLLKGNHCLNPQIINSLDRDCGRHNAVLPKSSWVLSWQGRQGATPLRSAEASLCTEARGRTGSTEFWGPWSKGAGKQGSEQSADLGLFFLRHRITLREDPRKWCELTAVMASVSKVQWTGGVSQRPELPWWEVDEGSRGSGKWACWNGKAKVARRPIRRLCAPRRPRGHTICQTIRYVLARGVKEAVLAPLWRPG